MNTTAAGIQKVKQSSICLTKYAVYEYNNWAMCGTMDTMNSGSAESRHLYKARPLINIQSMDTGKQPDMTNRQKTG